MANRIPVVAANWKMNKTISEGNLFVEILNNKILYKPEVDVILCVSYPLLFQMNSILGSGNIQLGAQNMHWELSGPFTGEVSPLMLKSCGVQWVILGHSERRHLFQETDEAILKKVLSALKSEIKPIFCVGEKIDERKSGRTEEVLERQLSGLLETINEVELNRFIFAYEPVWAIGTGENATPSQVEITHRFIREQISRRFPKCSEKLRIIYGGSVNLDNAKELIEVEGVDGFLVGGASLEVESFEKIINIVKENE